MKIYRTPYFEQHFSKYMVIYLEFAVRVISLKSARIQPLCIAAQLFNQDTEDDFEVYFAYILSELVHQSDFVVHFENLEPDDEDFMNSLRRSELRGIHLANALRRLSQILYKSSGQKVIILIDEYDTPITSAANEKMQKYVCFRTVLSL